MKLDLNDRPMRGCERAIESSRRGLSLCHADAEHRGAKNANKGQRTHVNTSAD